SVLPRSPGCQVGRDKYRSHIIPKSDTEGLKMAVAGKVVLVTGAARGMGREHVRGFLREGAKVVATDLSWEPTGVSNDDYRFLDEIEGNSNILTEIMDITIDSHVKRVYQAALARFGTIDV